MRIFSLIREFHNEESGQGFVEYLLMVALLGLAVIIGLGNAAAYINNSFTHLGNKLAGYVGT